MSTGGRLQDRIAVVTGASGGIGRAVALAFADEGAHTVVHYARSEEAARAVAAEVERRGRSAFVVRADLSRPDEISALARATLDRFGRVDVWANIAGADILTGDAARATDVEKLDRLLQVDLRGTVLASWAAADAMRAQADGGVILNMAWDYVFAGYPGREAELFAAAKGGIVAFSKCLARSVAPRVRVNVLAPGWIRTGYAESLPESARRALADPIPLGRFGRPEEVARAAVFLASADAAYITGQTLCVGGGEVML